MARMVHPAAQRAADMSTADEAADEVAMFREDEAGTPAAGVVIWAEACQADPWVALRTIWAVTPAAWAAWAT